MWQKTARFCLFFLILLAGGLLVSPAGVDTSATVATRYHARNRTRNFYESRSRSASSRAHRAARHW